MSELPRFPNFQNGTKGSALERRLAEVEKFISTRFFAEALQRILPILEDGHHERQILEQAALCYFNLGDAKTAISLHKVITERWPDRSFAWLKLAEMQFFDGDIEGSFPNFQRSLELDPKNIFTINKLYQIGHLSADDKHIKRLKRLEKSGKLTPRAQALASNVLGLIAAKEGRFRYAFSKFRKANCANPSGFEIAPIKAKVAEQKRAFQPITHPESERSGKRMIFVCGMPRSGTTLVENILGRHDQVSTVGESYALSQVEVVISQKKQADQSIWDWLSSCSEEDRIALRNFYHKTAFGHRPDLKDIIVDKMPLNCFDIGLAQFLLPEARFVFMVRHPMDVGLSNYTTLFAMGNGFSEQLPSIGNLTRLAYGSAEDFKAKLGDQMRMQSFRALVENPETQIRGLLEHVGLEWQQNCLTPEQGGGLVRTASVLQAREKINTKGLGKWKAYEEQLSPLLDALGGPVWLDDWQKLDERCARNGLPR